MFKKVLYGMTQARMADKQAELYRNLIRHEARIGGQIFGDVPRGGRREFFCLDAHTWVWHEEWTDDSGQHQTLTTRYDIHPGSIIRSQHGQYQQVGPEEANNLFEAAKIYSQRIKSEVYDFAQ